MTEEQLTQESFLSWLHEQVVDREFDYCDPQACLFASWLREAGLCDTPHVCSGFMYTGGGHGAGDLLVFPRWMSVLNASLHGLTDVFSVGHVRGVL